MKFASIIHITFFFIKVLQCIKLNLLSYSLKFVFEELLERVKEKVEKEARKRQRLADDFTKLLYTFKVF